VRSYFSVAYVIETLCEVDPSLNEDTIDIWLGDMQLSRRHTLSDYNIVDTLTLYFTVDGARIAPPEPFNLSVLLGNGAVARRVDVTVVDVWLVRDVILMICRQFRDVPDTVQIWLQDVRLHEDIPLLAYDILDGSDVLEARY
jgi:hypothetical protein